MERISIVGCGLVGRAWAIVFARAGHAVKVYDAAPGAARAAYAGIREGLEDLHRFGLLEEPPNLVALRVRATTTLAEAVQDADYVQENAPEDLEVKRELTRQIDQAAPASCILASSTSTFAASRISDGLAGRDRCLVAHPVNPPHLVPLVEIAPAPWTRPEVVARTRGLLERAGQTPILLRKEVEGFVLNRLQASLLREAWRLVDDGVVSVEDLDRTIRNGLGLRWSFMGPFETIDLNAPDGVAGYARRYGAAFHDLFRDVTYAPWNEGLVGRVEAERRALLPSGHRADRAAWRDRRLMALVAHQRKLQEQGL
jgi:3-hydroxyacyl-CoA dehydrogenase